MIKRIDLIGGVGADHPLSFEVGQEVVIAGEGAQETAKIGRIDRSTDFFLVSIELGRGYCSIPKQQAVVWYDPRLIAADHERYREMRGDAQAMTPLMAASKAQARALEAEFIHGLTAAAKRALKHLDGVVAPGRYTDVRLAADALRRALGMGPMKVPGKPSEGLGDE